MSTWTKRLPAQEVEQLQLEAKFFRGLGDPTRLKILELLLERERTVTQLIEALGVPQGRVSSHLACLTWCGYVTPSRSDVKSRLITSARFSGGSRLSTCSSWMPRQRLFWQPTLSPQPPHPTGFAWSGERSLPSALWTPSGFRPCCRRRSASHLTAATAERSSRFRHGPSG